MGRRRRRRRVKILREALKLIGRVVKATDGAQSRQVAPEPSPSPEALEDSGRVALMEQLDSFAPLRNALRGAAAINEGHWAGIPMPMPDAPLVIEPRYPNAKLLSEIGCPLQPEDPAEPKLKLRNQWWSDQKRGTIFVIEDENGKIRGGYEPGIHHLRHDLYAVGCSDAWGIAQEGAAVRLLATLVRHHQFKQYLLTGMFLESSERSRLMYLFRRLKPTVALNSKNGEANVLAALCLHPIAYYEGSWAGAMTPTDDVIAHLMLMRGDEALFWKRANQHPPERPEAGL